MTAGMYLSDGRALGKSIQERWLEKFVPKIKKSFIEEGEIRTQRTDNWLWTRELHVF